MAGDVFAYYALRGDISRVVAAGRVVGRPYFDESRVEDPGFPWLVPIELDVREDLIAEGTPLDAVERARNLLKSVQQKSHIRLTELEFASILRLLGSR